MPADSDPEGPRSVCLISAVNPYPTRSGKTVVLSGFVDYWVSRLGPDNVHFILVDRADPDPDDFPCRVHRVPPPPAREVLQGLVTRTLTGRASLQESVFWGPSLRRSLTSLLAKLAPDLVLFDTVRLGQYAAAVPLPPHTTKVIYLDDLFSERYRSMLAAGSHDRSIRYDALGNFSRHLPRALHPVINVRPVQRMLLRAEAQLVARSEDAAARSFDRALLVNDQETEHLRARSGSDRVHTTPPSIAVSGDTQRRWDGSPTLIVLGDWGLPHNADGLRWFLTRSLPIIRRARPDIRIRMIGPGADPELRKLAGACPEVTVEGYVDDLDDALLTCAAVLAPMRFGSGIKIKIVEACARGIPVVTTSVGAHGVGVGGDEGLMVADDPGDFAAAALTVCDPVTNAALSDAARRNYAESFSPAVVKDAYDEAFAAADA